MKGGRFPRAFGPVCADREAAGGVMIMSLEHEHEHTHTHSHDGMEHTHTHSHPHTHDHGESHDHAHSAAPEQETVAVLRYMLEHNIHHCGELKSLAEKISGEAQHQLLHAIEAFSTSNEHLCKAVELLDE